MPLVNLPSTLPHRHSRCTSPSPTPPPPRSAKNVHADLYNPPLKLQTHSPRNYKPQPRLGIFPSGSILRLCCQPLRPFPCLPPQPKIRLQVPKQWHLSPARHGRHRHVPRRYEHEFAECSHDGFDRCVWAGDADGGVGG